MTRTIVAGNWKMSLGIADAVSLAEALTEKTTDLPKHVECWIAPSFPALGPVKKAVQGKNVQVGSQNVCQEASGAFTGEVSVSMLQELGADFTIVGHSERRHVYGESDELVASRAAFAANENVPVILCVGELLDDREAGRTHEILQTQLDAALNAVTGAARKNLLIAYEPVWAIGTGKVATTTEIADAHNFLAEHWQKNVSDIPCPPILYGGSVKPNNFAEIIALEKVSGGLVGGASLSAESFGELLAIAAEAS